MLDVASTQGRGEGRATLHVIRWPKASGSRFFWQTAAASVAFGDHQPTQTYVKLCVEAVDRGAMKARKLNRLFCICIAASGLGNTVLVRPQSWISLLLGRGGSERAAPAEGEPEARRPIVVRGDKAAASRIVVPRAPQADDGDVEITLITAFPAAELAEARALANARKNDRASAPSLSAAPVTVGAEEEERPSRVEISYEEEAEADEVTSPNVRILICAVGDSDQGRVRSRNEDSFLAFPERSLFAVADGMGGHAGGDVASALAVDVLRDSFERNVFNAHTESSVEVPRRGREVACAIQMANEAIYSLAHADPQLHSMGTTMVVARFSPNKQRVYIGHVGDSRCYRLRGNVLRQLTNDHTMSSLGVKGPRGHDLFQAVGVAPSMDIDLIIDRPQGDDLYLLCSDGLSKMVSDEQICRVLQDESDIEAAVYGLMELANDSGGKDNITLILVKVIDRLGRQAFAMGREPPS